MDPVSKSSLWGEIPRAPGEADPAAITLTAAEREALLRIPRPIQLSGPKLYQPVGRTAAGEATRVKQEAKKESVLMRCARLQEALGKAPAAMAADEDELPLAPVALRRAGPFDTDYNFYDGDGAGGSGRLPRVPPSALSASAASSQLRRAVAEVFAAAGFSTTSSLAIDAATDSAGEVLRRICLRLKEAKEGVAAGGRQGFADCLERALAESGMPSVTGLQRYFEEEVVQFHNQLVEQVRERLQELKCGSSTDGGVLNPSSTSVPMYLAGDDNIPEIHFPSSEEGDGGAASASGSGAAAVLSLEHATPQLDAGMQMLQSLEQGGLTSAPGSAAATPAAASAAGSAGDDDHVGALMAAAASPTPPPDAAGASGAKKKKR